MKAKEFIIELNKELKPRNFVAKNASLAGKAGQHKDKKKAEKQGDVKHKKQSMPTESVATIPPKFPDHWTDEQKRAAWQKWIRDGTKKSIAAQQDIQNLANQMRKKQQGMAEAHGPYGKKSPSDIEKIKKYKEREAKNTVPGQLRKPESAKQKEKNFAKHMKDIAEGERNEMDTPEFQRALASLKKKAQQGPMKTVYDPKTGKYKVVPVKSTGEHNG
jgi:hypothetical protein